MFITLLTEFCCFFPYDLQQAVIGLTGAVALMNRNDTIPYVIEAVIGISTYLLGLIP